ncbi:serine/threonine-protein kinase [Streptomyces akebiae]|uniref:Serine/threonine protein kinase n=1 Tax=Streptomyces akebiae TaxID=2865673 RepID=A0ABX8XWY0_9ACTN|nr:serine/threonine-protein kinase [Streptomyces akebiae]QYX80431.1 serine/threonine protein kinase [Streptomyces akebiae]
MGEVRPGGQFRPLDDSDPKTVASYRLAARLGSGGMGTVYLSYTPGGHPIALKTIRPELSEDPEFRRRFRQEVQAAQRVQGLHTAPVIDYDTEGAQPWLATAYVPGPSLQTAVAAHGALPVSSVLLLLAGVAEALKVIHSAGIVHRDLKPSNVLLAADGPRVIDFGIARAADATALTGTGVSIGTPAFMSPEQAAGKPITPASDVFTLGQVAAYAGRGSGAYGDGPSHAVLYRIVHEEPDLTGLPDALRFIARCLAKNPEDRPTPEEVITLCQEASHAPLIQSGSWLPEVIGVDITRRVSASAELLAARSKTAEAPTAVPAPVPPTAPVTQPDVRAAGQATPPVHAAPTAFAGPVPPPLPSPAHPGPYAAQSVPNTVPPYHQTPHPQQPQTWHPLPQPRPLPLRPPKNTAGKWLGIGVGTLSALMTLGGCFAFLSSFEGSSGDSANRSGDTGSVSAKPLPDPKPVTYKGINIPLDYYIRFADSPPKPIQDRSPDNNNDADLYYDDVYGEALASRGAKIVLLNNAQKGSLKTCRGETRYADDVSLSQLSKGTQLCVHSSGHIALVTFRGTAPENDPSDYVAVDLTIWRNAEEPTDN